MDIFYIIILIFLVEVISFFINKGYSLSAVIVIMLLIPGILKFDVSVNLNVFNLAKFIFCGLLFLTRRHQTSEYPV